MQGPTEIDKHSQADMGLGDEDIQQLTLGWNATMGEVQGDPEGGRLHMVPDARQQNANAMPTLLKRSTCKAQLRAACAHGSSWQSHARLFGLTIENGTQFAQLEQDIAFFLIARGPYAWIGWGAWGMTWPFNPEPGHGALPPLPHGVPRPAQLDTDYGEPLGLCREVSAGIFEREWSKAGKVRLDCEAFEATIERRADLLETALRIATRLNATADCHNNKCTWKMNSTDSAPANYPYLATSLYYGSGGVALFLEQLHRATKYARAALAIRLGLYRRQSNDWRLRDQCRFLLWRRRSGFCTPRRRCTRPRVRRGSAPSRRPRAFGATILFTIQPCALEQHRRRSRRVRHGPLPAVGGTPRRLRLRSGQLRAAAENAGRWLLSRAEPAQALARCAGRAGQH